ncbi:UPF0544 protein C5orf45 homolog [Sinocyclocheilus rhinocerous]|uniref:UPF0544 protein C5orf45 homolog n=1 Tax=Sinocyclocheilus rhinocerous TaxID=307959 RepID=UPI0007B9A48A|nr:PREDICTED: UPF0544 protein C5orf45 homolog [Sinocyclocheilus rhinocerous]
MKWTCKVCGEKQSLMQEFGRGTAADCRRHVQKLNTLRGQMLEMNSCCHSGNRMKTMRTKMFMKVWSKTMNQSRKWLVSVAGVNTPIKQLRVQMDMKMKKTRTFIQKDTDSDAKEPGKGRKSVLKSFGGPYDNCEDEESWTGCSGLKRQPYLHDRRFN